MSRKKITLIGTFRQNPDTLKQVFNALETDFEILSPKSIEFIDLNVDFVKAGHEASDDTHTIQQRVLGAITQSDGVWLFAPNGHIGLSAAFEIGYCQSIGKKVYTDTILNDEMLNTMVEKIPSLDRLKTVLTDNNLSVSV